MNLTKRVVTLALRALLAWLADWLAAVRLFLL